MSQYLSHRTLDHAQIFYIISRLASVLSEKRGLSIVHAEDSVLGEMEKIGMQARTSLLAVDLQNSVLYVSCARCYSPYGFDAFASRESLTGFNGEPRDVSTGFDFLGVGHRIYNSMFMRFLSSDAESPFGRGGLNSYAYCGCDPVNYKDPSGTQRWRSTVRLKVLPALRWWRPRRSIPLAPLPKYEALHDLAPKLYEQAFQRLKNYNLNKKHGRQSKYSTAMIIGALMMDSGKGQAEAPTWSKIFQITKMDLPKKKRNTVKYTLIGYVKTISQFEAKHKVNEVRAGASSLK